MPIVMARNSIAIFVVVIFILLSGFALLGQLFPMLRKFTGFYALLFLATLLAYYTETLHLLLAPLGGELTVLAQKGNWTPTPWPLAFAGICLVMIGTALSAWSVAKGHAWGTLLQDAAVRGPISLLWITSSMYILGRAMSGLYSPSIVYATAIGLPILLFVLFLIDIDFRTPLQTVASVLRLMVVGLVLPFYGLLFLFTKVGDFLVYLYMRLLHPSISWLEKLRNWMIIETELLRRYRDWLITMIFDTSCDDLFKEDKGIRDLTDAQLLD
jgi:hypothetical protein